MHNDMATGDAGCHRLPARGAPALLTSPFIDIPLNNEQFNHSLFLVVRTRRRRRRQLAHHAKPAGEPRQWKH